MAKNNTALILGAVAVGGVLLYMWSKSQAAAATAAQQQQQQQTNQGSPTVGGELASGVLNWAEGIV